MIIMNDTNNQQYKYLPHTLKVRSTISDPEIHLGLDIQLPTDIQNLIMMSSPCGYSTIKLCLIYLIKFHIRTTMCYII